MPEDKAGTSEEPPEDKHEEPDEREQAKSVLAEALEPIQSALDELRSEFRSGRGGHPSDSTTPGSPPVKKDDTPASESAPKKSKTFADRWFG
jgi:hypothetical protein